MIAARHFLLAVVLSALLLGAAASPARAADLHLSDEREIYIALDKLNAMGLLPGFMANTRPYDMQAVRAAVQDMPWSGMNVPEETADLGRWVAWYAAPLASVRGQVSASYSSDRVVEWNNGGIPTPEGPSAGFSAIGRYEPSPWLSVGGKAVGWIGESDDRGARFREYSVEIGHKYFSLQAGEITTWYGPGRRGALIFTNNAEAYPGVRLHNPVPIPFTGFLSFLGYFQYDLFWARMDEDRPVPETTLSGMRLALRPNRYLEIGASRAMHYGGEGKSDGLGEWWEAFKGEEDGSPNKRNQLAGYDAMLTLPFKVQPVQLYLEMAGEDQTRGGGTNIVPQPKMWAMTGGVFFPSILGNPALDLRVEYADNRFEDDGEFWYVHPYSPHEYKGRILGHSMGTNARDFSVQGRWFLRPSTFLEFTVSKTSRVMPVSPDEETTGYRMAFLGWLTPSLRAGAGIHAQTSSNTAGVEGNRESGYAAWLDLAWRFSGGYAYLSSKEKP